MRNSRFAFAAGLASALLLSSLGARAQVGIRSLTGTIEGHEVGGVTIDMIGNIYAADFGDIVWRLTPEGERHELASGMYGTSGNAIDHEGNLLQASFYGDAITRIDRKGQATPFVTRGWGTCASRAIASTSRRFHRTRSTR